MKVLCSLLSAFAFLAFAGMTAAQENSAVQEDSAAQKDSALYQVFDKSVAEFARAEGETSDSPRISRAVEACPSGVLYIPAGVYEISEPIVVKNLCSLQMHKSAVLRAVKNMDFVLKVDTAQQYNRERINAGGAEDYNLFVAGGQIDGNGIASCMSLDNYHHFTLRETTFLNGSSYGLRVDGNGHGYELIANNLYFKCVKSGLAGNTALYTTGGDSHYTDCVVVDYTVGFYVGGGSNRLTRCHVWGGPIPPAAPGEYPEMLKDSINYKIVGSTAILRDCYADSGAIGFYVDGYDVRLLGCSYFNNAHFKLDNIKIIHHEKGLLYVSEASFVKTVPHVQVYEGCGNVHWNNIMYSGFSKEDDCPGKLLNK